VGHHFARPGNRFWPTLHLAGLTPRLYSPFEDALLLGLAMGVTNLVNRATASADELTAAELAQGARRLLVKLRRFKPHCLAFLGISAFRIGFGRDDVRIGRQDFRLAGTAVWILPNPSGLNAHYQLPDLAKLFANLRAERRS
jgi:TDG/mug DNA glycosylase family protein